MIHSGDSQDTSPNSSRYASFGPTQLNSPEISRKTLPGTSRSDSREDLTNPPNDDDAPSPEADEDTSEGFEGVDSPSSINRLKHSSYVPSVVSSAMEKVVGMGGGAVQGVMAHQPRDVKLKRAVKEEDVKAGDVGKGQGHEHGDGGGHDEHALKGEEGLRSQNNMADNQVISQLDKDMRSKLQGMSLDDESRVEPGEEVRLAARERETDVRKILGGRDGVGHKTDHESLPLDADFSLKKSRTGSYSLDDPLYADSLLKRDMAPPPEHTKGEL